MTIIATRSVQLKGHIYSKGEAAEWDGPIDRRMADLFVTKDGKPLAVTPAQPPPPNNGEGENKDAGEDKDAGDLAERIQKVVATLGRKGIEQKLDELNISFSSKANTEALAKLLLQQQGEI